MKNYRHIVHLVLIIVAIGIVALAVRAALIPPTFGQYGAYVGASVEEIRSKPVQYVGSDRCKDCHKKDWQKWERKPHQTVNCEVCHGPGAAHSVEEVEPRPLPLRSKSSGKMAAQAHDLCMSCHAAVPGRSQVAVPSQSLDEAPAKAFPQIVAKEHLAAFKITEESDDFEESMRCLTCHSGHDPLK